MILKEHITEFALNIYIEFCFNKAQVRLSVQHASLTELIWSTLMIASDVTSYSAIVYNPSSRTQNSILDQIHITEASNHLPILLTFSSFSFLLVHSSQWVTMRPHNSQLSWSKGGGPGEVTLVLQDPVTLRSDLESASRSLWNTITALDNIIKCRCFIFRNTN